MSDKLFPRCPVRTTFELLSGKWRFLLISELSAGPLRFGEIRQRLDGISDKVLAQELQIMQDSQIIERLPLAQHASGPASYQLSEIGKLTLPLLASIRDFGIAYSAQIYSSGDNNTSMR